MSHHASFRLVTATIGVLAACGGSSSTGIAGPTGPEKSCLDTVEAIARAAERCGGDYKVNYDATLKGAAGGDCKNVIRIRDENALRATCLPSLQTVACAQLTVGNIDATCRAQLQRPASFEPELYPASFVADVVE